MTWLVLLAFTYAIEVRFINAAGVVALIKEMFPAIATPKVSCRLAFSQIIFLRTVCFSVISEFIVYISAFFLFIAFNATFSLYFPAEMNVKGLGVLALQRYPCFFSRHIFV